MAKFKTLDDLDVAGKRVLVRVDLNVPMRDGLVSDATRIDAVRPTILELLDKGANVVLASHFGRPKGQVVPDLSLAPIVPALSAALGRAVSFGDGASGELVLLENLRFDPGEEANDPAFAGRLAALADLYVDDAFSCAHRAHASIDGIARLLPSAAGRLLEKELTALTQALEAPEHPVMAVVGGNKISTKIGVLENLIKKVDHLVIGGAMANTFLLAGGVQVGNSLVEADMTGTARKVIQAAAGSGCGIVLPSDGLVAAELAADVDAATVPADRIPADKMMLDIGPATTAAIIGQMKNCRTLIWNGPLGAFEFPPFDQGTREVAGAAADRTRSGDLLSVAGGGDTVAALATANAVEAFSYVSTAGGAFLEWLEGKSLPGVDVLSR